MQDHFEHPRPGQLTICCVEGINIPKLARGIAEIFGKPVTVGQGEHVNGVPVGTILIGDL